MLNSQKLFLEDAKPAFVYSMLNSHKLLLEDAEIHDLEPTEVWSL
jgi:hypothetical protein